MRVIGYTYEASIHCEACARGRFGDSLDNPETVDREGNPIHPIFSYDDVALECCDDCREGLITIMEYLFSK